MPRLRRNIPFPLELREQIRGGVWHKSALYDGLRRAPPAPFPGRVPKKSIPKLVFVEDELIRDFAINHPALAHAERKERDEMGRKLGGTPAVSNAFVREQLRALAEDASPADAAEAARRWLIEHGPSLLDRVRLTKADRDRLEPHDAIDGDGVPKKSPEELMRIVMQEQVETVKGLVRERAAGRKVTTPHVYRSWMTEEETKKIQKRNTKNHGENSLPTWRDIERN